MDLLDAEIQGYAWGDRSFIAELQGREPTGEPEAELWMGAHPKAPSRLSSSGRRLDELIAEDPAAHLGSAASQFDSLPFLKKVLAAAEPLSIQTHPDLATARAGYARENDEGIALDSPVRTYRDANHKPELICALTPFIAKCGFRSVEGSLELLSRIDDRRVDPLRQRLQTGGPDADVLAATLHWLLSGDVTDVTAAVIEAAATTDDGPWADEIRYSAELAAIHPGDAGIVVALLLNHFVLAPGEALFLEAGNLHAYMQGAGIEIMANSDNVIRGGLTVKHVDTTELARVVDCSPIDPPVQRPAGEVHRYESPVPEFALTRIVTTEGAQGTVTGPEILIATEGSFHLTSGDNEVQLTPGEPAWVSAADTEWTAEGSGVLFRATVPA